MVRSGRVGRPQGGDSAETLERILAAARTRFAELGYRATTNKVIADDVGITTGALYHYVPSKAALYAEVYRDTVDYVYSDFERVVLERSGLINRFLAVLRRATELHEVDSSITGFIVAVSQETQRNPDLIELLGSQRARHVQFFAWLVQRSIDEGELVDAAQAKAVADLRGSTLTGLARLAVTTSDVDRYRGAVDAMAGLLDHTLLVPSD